MCTAATYKTKDFYFGRTLDYEFSYGDQIVITPRNYAFNFRHVGDMKNHYAIIGMAHVAEDYPLYYDAMNEKGVAMAGLNFVGNAVYAALKPDVENIAQFEFIPWILSQCSSLVEVRELLERINIVNTPFSEQLPLAQLHWIISDENESITVESMSDGLHIYDNPVGVLTNNPPFPQQMFQLNNYIYLSPKQPRNTFCENLALDAYSRGMGGLGLPGDLSSSSRFVRVAFTKVNAISGESEEESVSQFFHILGSVDQQRGCCEVTDGKYEITLYTSCCNVTKGIYYYNTYENHQISAVDTIQVDYNLPERFELEYTGEDNKKHRPVMIHRAPFGSMERFVAVLIEHTGGKFPLWLTPDQVAILPISEKFNDYAYEVKRQLEAEDLSVLVDDRNEKIGRKIRDTELKRIPYMLIVGEKEAENNEVSVRKQGEGDKGSMKITTFAALLKGEVEDQMNHWKKDNN